MASYNFLEGTLANVVGPRLEALYLSGATSRCGG